MQRYQYVTHTSAKADQRSVLLGGNRTNCRAQKKPDLSYFSSSKGSGSGIYSPWRVSGLSYRPEPGSVREGLRASQTRKISLALYQSGVRVL